MQSRVNAINGISFVTKMSNIKRFLFRCCSDVDEEDIFVLTGIRPDFHSSQDRWYSIEADEFDDQLLAVANLQFSGSSDLDRSCSAKSIKFFEDTMTASNSAGTSLSKYFFRQLCNIALQSGCSILSIELTNYSDVLVAELDELGFREDGGYFSETLGKMVHTFSTILNQDISATAMADEFNEPTSSFLSSTTFADDNDFDANPEMKSLISDLFRALHNESS